MFMFLIFVLDIVVYICIRLIGRREDVRIAAPREPHAASFIITGAFCWLVNGRVIDVHVESKNHVTFRKTNTSRNQPKDRTINNATMRNAALRVKLFSK